MLAGRIAELEAALAQQHQRAETLQQALAQQKVDCQAQLREQTNRYQLLFETMAQGVISYAADGAIVDANPAAQHILGLSLKQLQERCSSSPCWGAVHADGTDFPQEEFPAALALRTGQPVLGAVMGIDDPRSQCRRWISVNAIPLFRAGETRPYQVDVTLADSTARIEVEAQLRQSAAQYRYLFEHNPRPMWAFDEESLRFLAVNDAAVASYGYTRDEFLSMTIQDIRPPADRARLAEHVARKRPDLSTAGLWQHQRKDGSLIDVEITSHAIEIFGRRARLVAAQDVTARLVAESALYQSEARFATIFARSPIALSISRVHDGVITDVNEAFINLFGHTREAIIGRTTLELGFWAHPEDRQPALEQLRAQQRIASYEALLRSAAGVEHQVLLSAELVEIADQPHVLMQMMDISVLKQAQQQLQELNQTLELRVEQRTAEVRALYELLRQANAELSRAAQAKDEFLANMSHELRTPINAILGYSENLQEHIYGALSERQQRAIATIESGGRHLLTLINDILDLSKVEAGRLDLQPQPVLIQEVCRSSLGFVREQALKKRLRLNLQLNDQDAVLVADATRLKQILVNLLSNAVKFTPEGGAVDLEVGVDTEESVARFSVHDTGIGIAAPDLGRLFQPFSQIDSSLARETAGTGLGLALVRRLAELHGGSVSVESAPGQGSHFTVTLPYHPLPITSAVDAPPQAVMPAEPAEHVGARPHGRILLVDDNETNVSAICEYLHAMGYMIHVAGDGYAALALADEVQPDLILMDIQMPQLDGLAAIRRLRAVPTYAATPIIALTALAMPGDKERCLAAGATAYMPKPVRLRTLMATIQQLLDG